MVIAELRAGEAPPSVVIDIVRRLERGEVLVLPTDTVYGLHALSRHASAVKKIRAIKGLDWDRPLSNLFNTVVGMGRFVQLPEGESRRRILESWPGAVTWVLPAQPGAPRPVTGQDGTIGIRIPNHQFLRSICAALDDLIVSTSANRHGEPPALSRDQLDPGLLKEVDGIVYQSDALPGRPSEVKRWTADGAEILRNRPLTGVESDHIHILVVCTGNSCRSPMAEGLLRDRLDREAPGKFVVRSAGTTTEEGLRASLSAVEVMREKEIDISNHRSRPLDDDLVDWSHLILPMTSDQISEVDNRFDSDSGKVFLFTAYPDSEFETHEDIPDPIGHGIERYREVRNRIEQEVDRMIPHLLTLVR